MAPPHPFCNGVHHITMKGTDIRQEVPQTNVAVLHAHREDMKPSIKASVLGHQYILLTILGERAQGQSILNDCVTLFRRVLDDYGTTTIPHLP